MSYECNIISLLLALLAIFNFCHDKNEEESSLKNDNDWVC